MIAIPESCPRQRGDCRPLSQIVADDESTFVCCGSSERASRRVLTDCFRFCARSETVDSVQDLDTTDLVDQVAVLSRALAVGLRLP